MFASINWEDEMKDKDVEQAWAIFLYHYHSIVQETAPLYIVHRGRAKKKWMTNEILRLIHRKEAM